MRTMKDFLKRNALTITVAMAFGGSFSTMTFAEQGYSARLELQRLTVIGPGAMG